MPCTTEKRMRKQGRNFKTIARRGSAKKKPKIKKMKLL
jgi:hypothetical protein